MIRCKRVYEEPARDDGYRLLVDRLWPRGLHKDHVRLDDWCPDLAPSADLRRAFKHGELGFAEFRQAYRAELAAHPEHWWPLLEKAERGVTLVYAARDEQQNNARVLAEWLEEELERRSAPSSPTCYAGEL